MTADPQVQETARRDGPSIPALAGRVELPRGTAGQHSVKLARSMYSGPIARALREAIVDGEFPPGTPLVEHQLAEQLAVSRGPIRSALQVLQGEGLVETLPNGRTVTMRFAEGDLRDLLAIRRELESSAVRRGCAARADIGPIRAAYDEMQREGASTEHLTELDIEFHRRLVEFGGSRFLLSAWLALAPVIQAVITIGNRRLAQRDPESNFRRILGSHERVLEPLSRYDADATITVLAEQFSITESQYVPSETAPAAEQ
jgi:DNA-binding GntR family transcriptional regulator